MSNLHPHTIHTHVNVLFGDVMYFGLRGKVEGVEKVWSRYKSNDHIGIV